MGVVQTGAIYKGFTFDGIDSKTYGVYISGDAVFNAPERDVEMIEIPGRNGAFALDKGRFANITVTYPAGLFGDTEADFAQGISDLRNALASRKGYCRLEDEYNPNEYRMAVYRSGLEVDPAQLKAGAFEIVFDCMPQRYLTSGETAVIVTNGGTLTNPTLFDARPMLEVSGYGNININNETVSIMDVPIGNILFKGAGSVAGGQIVLTDASDKMNNGDDIKLTDAEFYWRGHPDLSNWDVTSLTKTDTSNTFPVSFSVWSFGAYHEEGIIQAKLSHNDALTFSYGTAVSYSRAANITMQYTSGGTSYTKNGTFTFTVAYNGSDTITITGTISLGIALFPSVGNYYTGDVIGTSTKGSLGSPLYFDLDIGEAYKIENDVVISVNNAVSFPAELPVLNTGANTITFDNTVTQLKVIPRWWCV